MIKNSAKEPFFLIPKLWWTQKCCSSTLENWWKHYQIFRKLFKLQNYIVKTSKLIPIFTSFFNFLCLKCNLKTFLVHILFFQNATKTWVTVILRFLPSSYQILSPELKIIHVQLSSNQPEEISWSVTMPIWKSFWLLFYNLDVLKIERILRFSKLASSSLN